MDLDKITDIQQLKALAYDELQKLEITQQNIRMINQRIQAIEEAANSKPSTK